MNPTTVAHRPWPGPAFPYVVGESTRMQDVYDVMTRVAEGDANVCIEGESGTGKELIAETLHAVGRRRDRPFVTHFLWRKAARHREAIRGLTSRALESLVANPWPGNVRQLENWIERAVVLAGADLVDVEHFPPVVRDTTAMPLPPPPRRLRLREVEKLYVLETLEQTRWNRTAAARLL